MYPQSFLKNLNYKLRELELIIRQINNEYNDSGIDIDLALDKTRDLYALLIGINSPELRKESGGLNIEDGSRPVVPSDPGPLEDDKIYEAEGITPSPVHSKTDIRPEDPDAGEDPAPEHEPVKNKSEEDLKNDPEDSDSKQNGQHDIEIVADRYQSSQNYINQAIANKQTKKDLTTKLQSKPIEDLKNSIGLNEKFLFIKELFRGRPEKYGECIDILNNSGSYDEAMNYIRSNYSWDENDEVAGKLINLLKRKYHSE